MMGSLAIQRDALMPRPPGGMGPGLLLALIVHLGLVVALAIAVHWHASEPAGVEAELWAAVPQVAAPRAVEPEPTPTPTPPRPTPTPRVEPLPDAQIAIERTKREAQERKKKEQTEQLAEKKRLEQEALRKKQADEAKLGAQREANLKRIMGQAGATGDASATGSATQSAGPSAGYAGRIKARIKPNIVFTDTISGNPVAEVEVRLAPDGRILSHKLLKASGVAEWDDAVQRAIDRTEVLPRDIDGRVPPTMVIAFRPRD
ncbi:cell envelope integrity protein TolA [Piscinibacter sp.]|jgi:colicin import membrane protein|uniref:cell envelope integrity protein TolA n=1 Tax=Piscinibacter sp. TaxID=1903157 RepID=UPI002F3F76EF